MSKNNPGGVPLPSAKRGLKRFYRETIQEMKHVHWPTWKESNRLTGVVLAVCTLAVVILLALSEGFDTLFSIALRGGR